MNKRSINEKIFSIAIYPAGRFLDTIRYEPEKGLAWLVVAVVTAPVAVPVMVGAVLLGEE